MRCSLTPQFCYRNHQIPQSVHQKEKECGLVLVVSLELQTQVTRSEINARQGNTSDSLGLLNVIILELNVRANFMCVKERKCYV